MVSGNGATEKYKNRTDFMLEEYKQIASAFFNLSNQRSKMIQHYLVLVTIPVGLVTAVLALGDPPPGIFELPQVVGVFSLVVGIMGLLVNAILIHLRFEMVFYARTINLVREYFAEHGEGPSIRKYLGLPTTDDLPHFSESPWSDEWWAKYTGIFFEILFIGFISFVLFCMALPSLFPFVLPLEYLGWSPVVYLLMYVLSAIVSIGAPLYCYSKWAEAKETAWSKKDQQQSAAVSGS